MNRNLKCQPQNAKDRNVNPVPLHKSLIRAYFVMMKWRHLRTVSSAAIVWDGNMWIV